MFYLISSYSYILILFYLSVYLIIQQTEAGLISLNQTHEQEAFHSLSSLILREDVSAPSADKQSHNLSDSEVKLQCCIII